ncbi:MAG: GNAT family N-acetyltransferase [Clostridia bacterium]|nr:GNAT family N-acetyltransferase [Clostridia bacterium]
MKTIDYFDSDRKEHWLAELGRCDWRAGAYLCALIRKSEFSSTLGEGSKLLLLTDGDELISFCTYSKNDCISDTELSPWVGFVYTYPERRGNRFSGLLFEEVKRIAKKEGVRNVYVATDHTGLYEKYGCEYMTMMKDVDGNMTRVYVMRTG